jgi:hypothetical protein
VRRVEPRQPVVDGGERRLVVLALVVDRAAMSGEHHGREVLAVGGVDRAGGHEPGRGRRGAAAGNGRSRCSLRRRVTTSSCRVRRAQTRGPHRDRTGFPGWRGREIRSSSYQVTEE